MRTLMTLALTIFSMTACAVDTTSTDDVAARAAIDLTDDEGDDVPGTRVRCTTNDDCATGACDILTRACITPEGDEDSEDDTAQPDDDVVDTVPAPDDGGTVPPPRPERCTLNSHCESNTCDLATRMCVPAEAPPRPPQPELESDIARDGLLAAPEHAVCNPLINCYPF